MVLERLQKLQNAILCKMHSVPRTTSTAALHAVADVVPVATRAEELFAGWLTRAWGARPGLMLRETYKAYLAAPLRASCFAQETKNAITVAARKALHSSGRRGREDRRDAIRTARAERREAATKELRAKCPALADEHGTLRKIDQLPRKARRTILLWILGRGAVRRGQARALPALRRAHGDGKACAGMHRHADRPAVPRASLGGGTRGHPTRPAGMPRPRTTQL